MLGFSRRQLLIGFAAVVFTASIVSLALVYFFPAPSSTISFSSGFKGGSYEQFTERYRKILERRHVKLELRQTGGAGETINLLDDPESGLQAGLVQGGSVEGAQASGLLSLGRVNYQIFCIFHRASDKLDDLTELRGKRVAVFPVGTGTRIVSDKVLAISGVTTETATLLSLGPREAVDAVVGGTADAAFLGFASDAPILQSILRDSRVQLMSVARTEALTRHFPFLVRLVLPQGAIDFANNIPASDVVLFSTTNSLVVRSDLHPALIRLLAEAVLETHDKPGLFQQAGEFPKQTDPDFPMAESALDFYKNGHPFLERYMPTWLVPHFQRLLAVLVAMGAIVLPIFSVVPKLFRSFVEYRLSSMYRRLREIEATLQIDNATSQVSTLSAELASIDRNISLFGIPKQYSDLFFSIKSHLDVVRTRLESRRAELQGKESKAA